MSKRVVLEDGKGNKLHPMTLGKCVTTESGETVDGLVSKTQMFSPVIAMDSSMNKVGVGNDIDVHSNVKDGAYEECVFEGRTLINCYLSSKEMTWNLNLNNWTFHITKKDSFLLKPSTTYSIIIYVTEKTCPSHKELFWVGDVDAKKDKVTQDVVRKNVELGVNVFVINTVSDFSNLNTTRDGIAFQGSKLVEGTLKWKAIVLEGDWNNKELPEYFTGMCDVKMPILHNVGKNLCGAMELGSLNVGEGLPEASATRIRTIDYIPLQQNSYTISTETATVVGRRYYDGNKKFIINKTINTSQKPVTVLDAPSNAKFLKLTVVDTTDINYKIYVTKDVHKQGEYEDHKTNILRTSDEVVLRSVGNVKDTYNALTGEFVKRIGEVVFNGSESGWALTVSAYQPVNVDYINFDIPVIGIKTHSRLYCDTIPTREPTIPSTSLNSYSIGGHSTSEIVRLCIEKSKASTVEQLKTYLQSKPFTIQYELATPITTIIKPTTIPFSYANGHVILETGSSGQSLLPTLKYSVTTGRTGQITQNAKILRQQEKQIASLEDLLLTQIVQMDYERTLLQFDFELNTNGLG